MQPSLERITDTKRRKGEKLTGMSMLTSPKGSFSRTTHPPDHFLTHSLRRTPDATVSSPLAIFEHAKGIVTCKRVCASSTHGISTGVPDWLTTIVFGLALRTAETRAFVAPGSLFKGIQSEHISNEGWDILHIRTVEAFRLKFMSKTNDNNGH